VLLLYFSSPLRLYSSFVETEIAVKVVAADLVAAKGRS
jgi:hypothetical protein